jgi:hypothetical protein
LSSDPPDREANGVRATRAERKEQGMKRLTLAVAGLLAVAALASASTALGVPATSTSHTGGLHFVGTPDVTATKTLSQAYLTATGEVAGAGKTATATLSANAEVTTGCINRGSKDQEPSGLKRTTTTATGTTTFHTRSGRGTFTVSTVPITTDRNCPDQMRPVLVSVTFTDVTLTVTSQTGTATATFPDIDP